MNQLSLNQIKYRKLTILASQKLGQSQILSRQMYLKRAIIECFQNLKKADLHITAMRATTPATTF